MAANLIQLVIAAHDQASAQIRLVNKSIAEMEATSAGLSATTVIFAGLGIAIATVAAAAAEAGREYIAQVEQLKNLSNATGLTVPQMEAVRAVLGEAGLSADTVRMAIQNLNREIAQGNPLLKQMGVTTRDAYEAFIQINTVLAGFHDKGVASTTMMALFGGRSRELIGAQALLATELPRATDEFVKQYAAMELARDAAERLDNASDRLGRVVGMAWQRMGGAMAVFLETIILANPTLHGIYLKLLQDGAIQTKAMAKATEDLEARIRAMLNTAKGAKEFFKPEPWTRAGGPFQGPGNVVGGIEIEAQRIAGGAHLPETMEQWLETWRKTHEEMAAISSGFVDGVISGFQQIAQMIFDQSITIGRALQAFFGSVIQTILSALARLAAAWTLIGIGNLLTGGLGGFLVGTGKSLFAGTATPAGAARAGGDTFILQSYNMRDTVRDLTSPFGSLRRAADQLRVGSVA